MNLFGVENETVIKSLQQMQNLMAITQALPALDNGVKAFKRLGLVIKSATAGMNGFKAALMSTGIGALVVALGALVANWDKVTEAMKKWGIINEDTKKKLDEQRKKVDKLREEYDKLYVSYKNWEKSRLVNKLNDKAKEQYEELADKIEELSYKEQLARNKAAQLWETEGQAAGDAKKKEADAYKTQIELLQQQQRAILANADSYKN